MAKKKSVKKSSKKPVKKAAKKKVVKKAAKKKVVKKAAKKKVVKAKRCAATMKDPKTGRSRRCKNKAAGNSKYCASHKKK